MIINCLVFILITKLKIFESKLKEWNMFVFGNVHYKVKTIEEYPIAIQVQTQLFGDDNLKESELEDHTKLDVTLQS